VHGGKLPEESLTQETDSLSSASTGQVN